MTPAFLRAIAFVLPHEEEFARGHWGDENFVVSENVDGDAGGLTKYGIDARSHPGVDIERLTKDRAIAIYAAEWQRRGLDVLPARIACAVFDVFVNGGQAIAWLQTALNQTRAPGERELIVDGSMGPVTIATAHECDETAVLKIFIAERDARFERLAAARPKLKKFLDGWKQRDRDLRKYLGVA